MILRLYPPAPLFCKSSGFKPRKPRLRGYIVKSFFDGDRQDFDAGVIRPPEHPANSLIFRHVRCDLRPRMSVCVKRVRHPCDRDKIGSKTGANGILSALTSHGLTLSSFCLFFRGRYRYAVATPTRQAVSLRPETDTSAGSAAKSPATSDRLFPSGIELAFVYMPIQLTLPCLLLDLARS